MPIETSPHDARIHDQFTRQAVDFAAAPELHNDAILTLLMDAAGTAPDAMALDVACGPGSVVLALAARVRHATGLDATTAMLDQARTQARDISNVSWQEGDVYALPFPADHFDIVTCRFAFHHFERPEAALAEMTRVCKPGGTVVVCDAMASEDPAKALAFNHMEKWRDPSTTCFLPLTGLRRLFGLAGLSAPAERFFQVPSERERMVTRSFPQDDDYAGLRRLIDNSVEGDKMGMGARRSGDTVLFAYPSVILAARKPLAKSPNPNITGGAGTDANILANPR